MKFLLFAIVGLLAYYIWWRGAKIRKREITEAEKRKTPVETLVFDPKKRAYVPKTDKTKGRSSSGKP